MAWRDFDHEFQNNTHRKVSAPTVNRQAYVMRSECGARIVDEIVASNLWDGNFEKVWRDVWGMACRIVLQ